MPRFFGEDSISSAMPWVPLVHTDEDLEKQLALLAELLEVDTTKAISVTDSTLMDFVFAVAKQAAASVPLLQRPSTPAALLSLYDGACGSVVLLACLARVTGDAVIHAQTLTMCNLLLARVIELEAGASVVPYPGGYSGLTGVLVALSQCGALLAEPVLCLSAIDAMVTRVGSSATTAAILQDTIFDVMDGSAGLILGLCVMLEHCSGLPADMVSPEDLRCRQACLRTALELAADHVVASATPAAQSTPVCGRVSGGPHDAVCWYRMGSGTREVFTGFSHGGTGIAFALRRAFAIIGKPAYAAFASKGEAFEDLHFNAGCVTLVVLTMMLSAQGEMRVL